MASQNCVFANSGDNVALLSFINLAGMEKAILAIVLGYKALAAAPPPALERRRGWAKAGAVLGATDIVLVASVILLNLDRWEKSWKFSGPSLTQDEQRDVSRHGVPVVSNRCARR